MHSDKLMLLSVFPGIVCAIKQDDELKSSQNDTKEVGSAKLTHYSIMHIKNSLLTNYFAIN